nr:MAG TPA: hypothetical protein [Caudoviricetes sp.]
MSRSNADGARVRALHRFKFYHIPRPLSRGKKKRTDPQDVTGRHAGKRKAKR